MEASLTIDEAATVVARGGVIVMPTETVYGLAGRPTQDVVERIGAIKQRAVAQSMQLLIPSRGWLGRLATATPVARSLADAFWPGPLTLVVAASADAPAALAFGGTIGLRVPAHPIASDLLARCGPLAASSANRTGEPTPETVDALSVLFADEVDGYLDGGRIEGAGSTVVDASGDTPLVLREGPIRAEDVLKAI